MTMWWKLLLLTIYLVCLFVLSRILEAVAYYEGGYLASRLLDPVSLSVRKLKTLLDQRGVSFAGVVEKQELTDLIDASGDVTEGELEVATTTDDEATSTNFTCGSHFYEEVEDTKDSVWLVQVVPNPDITLMRSEDWRTMMRKVSRFGVRTGIFDCSLDWQSCHRKKWYTPRLILALPQGHRHKDNVILHSYTGVTKTQAVFDWVNLNLASRTKQIFSYKELQKDWFTYEKIKRPKPKVRVVLFSKMKFPAMFYSALSVKFTGRVKFGTVNSNRRESKNIMKELGYRKIPKYMIITPEKNVTYGDQSGQFLNFKSMELLFRTLQPEANDMFLLCLVLINIACWLELFIVQGGIFHRIGSLIWCIGKWNCIFLLLWLPLVGLFQLSYMEIITDYLLRIIRLIGTTELAAEIRFDFLNHISGNNSNFAYLMGTFLVYGIILGILEFRRTGGQVPDSNNNDSDWRNLGWDGYYMNYLFRPMSLSVTRPMNTQDLDLEVGMELLIERLAVPNFWLSPMISSDYVKDLPVWKHTGLAVDSDSESGHIDSDTESLYSNQCKTEAPYMFICEKCRVMARGPDHRSLQELADNESACAKYLMDGDYTCMCSGADGNGCHSHKAEGWHSDDEVIRKPNRSRHRTLSSDNLLSYDNQDLPCQAPSMQQSHASIVRKNASAELTKTNHTDHKSKSSKINVDVSCMPPGILPCHECVICLEHYAYGVLLCGLPCGHSFHQQCIMGWLSRDNHCCPVCRWPTYKAKPCSLHLHSE